MKTLILNLLILASVIVVAQNKTYVTVYNNDLGVIKETRNLDIQKGISEVIITDVAERIDPTSVKAELAGTVIEQNYRYDLVSMSKILQKYIDKKITLRHTENSDIIISGKLLSVGSQPVIQKSDGGIEMISGLGDCLVSVDEMPDNFITKPSLVWTVDAEKSGKQDVNISYMTGGMNWHAEYVAVLNEDDTHIDLNSWVSVENNSGTEYKNAVLKLVAGDVNRVRDELIGSFQSSITFDSKREEAFEEKSLMDYHIYDLQRPTTLLNNEQKQISLFEKKNVKVEKKYEFTYNGPNQKNVNPQVKLQFYNKSDNKLGIPMPKGKIRVYKKSGEELEFVGENSIQHTPRNEKIDFTIGNAFDIRADFQTLNSQRIGEKTEEAEYSIEIRNQKDSEVEVDLLIHFGTYRNWEVLDKNFEFQKKNAGTIIVTPKIKSEGSTILKYKVRFSFM